MLRLKLGSGAKFLTEKGEGKFDSNSLNEDFTAKCFESLNKKTFDNFCCQLRKGLCCKVLQKSTVNAEVKVWVIKLSSLGERSSLLLKVASNSVLQPMKVYQVSQLR